MSDPLTILHLTHSGHGAGSSVSIALLAREQARQGHRVVVGCPPGTWLERLIRDRGGAAYAPIDFSATKYAAFEIERLVWMLKVDVVNAHSSKDRAACRRLRLRRRLPPALVMTRRAMPMSSLLSGLVSGYAADRTIAVSLPVAGALAWRGTPRSRIRLVRNAVDLSRVDRAVTDEERRWVGKLMMDAGWRPTIGMPIVGMVARRKDHEVLVRALEAVATPITLCLVGFQPDEKLRHLPFPGRHQVVWIPFQDDVRPFYDLFDVVALSTRLEGLSQGLLEAMALGRAVVTTEGGGNRDVIEDGVHGLLVRPGDAPALGRAIQRLLESSELRETIGAAARTRVRSEFTIERTAAETEAVYREAIARRRGARR